MHRDEFCRRLHDSVETFRDLDAKNRTGFMISSDQSLVCWIFAFQKHLMEAYLQSGFRHEEPEDEG